jgi:hypothetical protein
MKLAIVGSRTFEDYPFFSFYAKKLCLYDVAEIVSGGAKGADSLAKKFAAEWNFVYTEFPAEWNKYGKSAGFIRNQTIVDNCDMVLAFWDGVSRGTADTIAKAKKAKKPTFIVYY